MRLNLPAFILAAIAAGNPHQFDEAALWTALILQWFVLGFLAAYIVQLPRWRHA
jgi:Na+-driven multidrug efflux pump